MPRRTYYVYILASLASQTRRLYAGVTRDLPRRVWEHRTGALRGRSAHHAARYAINRLVHYEGTENIGAAIAREKQVKAWTRAKRVALIEATNAGWHDLATSWFPGTTGPVTPDSRSLAALGTTGCVTRAHRPSNTAFRFPTNAATPSA